MAIDVPLNISQVLPDALLETYFTRYSIKFLCSPIKALECKLLTLQVN